MALTFVTHALQEEGPFPYGSHLSRASVQPEAGASGGQEGRVSPTGHGPKGAGLGSPDRRRPHQGEQEFVHSTNIFLTDICAG